MNDVEKFIKRFKTPENGSIFAGDCSYWFAAILYRRFIREGAKIMFDTATNHFGTMVNGKVYDITGERITSKHLGRLRRETLIPLPPIFFCDI